APSETRCRSKLQSALVCSVICSAQSNKVRKSIRSNPLNSHASTAVELEPTGDPAGSSSSCFPLSLLGSRRYSRGHEGRVHQWHEHRELGYVRLLGGAVDGDAVWVRHLQGAG